MRGWAAGREEEEERAAGLGLLGLLILWRPPAGEPQGSLIRIHVFVWKTGVQEGELRVSALLEARL